MKNHPVRATDTATPGKFENPAKKNQRRKKPFPFGRIFAILIILFGFVVFVFPLALKYVFHQSANQAVAELSSQYAETKAVDFQPVQIETMELAASYDYSAEELEQAQRDPGLAEDIAAIGDDLSSLDQPASADSSVVVIENASSKKTTTRVKYIMEIPAIDLKVAAIRSKSFDDMYRCMRLGAAIFPKAPELNTIGNICISAHRTGSKDFFRHLDQLKDGDTIVLRSETESYQYAVVKMEIIDPDDWSVTGQTLFPALTLLSCQEYQGVSHGQRIMVQAKLIAKS